MHGSQDVCSECLELSPTSTTSETNILSFNTFASGATHFKVRLLDKERVVEGHDKTKR